MKYTSLIRTLRQFQGKILGIVFLLMIGHSGFSQFVIGTIPKGDSIIIQHDVTIITSPPPGTNHVAAQWTIMGMNFASFLSDDPDTVMPLDSTITPIQLCNISSLPVIKVLHNPLCPGSQDTLVIMSGTLGDATHWQWYTTGCGGTPEANQNLLGDTLFISPSATTTYYVRGEGDCVTGAPCASVTVNILVINAPTVTQPTCAVPSGTIVVNTNVGTSILEYRLNGGPWQTSNTFSGLSTGTYNIDVRNQGVTTCFVSYSGNPVTINTMPVIPTVDPVGNQTVCNNTSTTTVIFTGTPGGTIFNWTNNTPSIGLAASGSGDILSFIATNATASPVTATITVTPEFTNAGGTCNGTPITFTITVNPTATINPVANQVVCNGALTTAVNFTSPTTGGSIVYNWTNTNTAIGLAASGSGNISAFTATNATNAPISGTITITPAYTNGGVTCNGTPASFTITVNPTATINPVANQVVCNGALTTAVNFTSPTTGGSIVYNWTNTNTAIGLAASGSGNISAFTATNATNAPISGTITITPAYTNGGVTCNGTPVSFSITVNPTATINPVANQVVCNGALTTAINFNSPTTGGSIVYNWTNTNTAIGLTASGSGNISAFTATNATNAPISGTITITPAYTNGGETCNGTPVSFTITVNPAATINPVANQVVCNGALTSMVTFTSPTTGGSIVYNWTNTNPAIGLAASGSGNISAFTSTNATNAPISGTITITPVYTNGAVTCNGTPFSFTITVNPTPNVMAAPASQTKCSGVAITTIVLTGNVAGTIFNWTRDNTVAVTGIAASGAGDISGTLTNTTAAPVTVTFTITPTANGCPGTPVTATVLVNPTPNAVAVPASQTKCSGVAITTIVLTGNVSGTIFNWTRDNTVAVTGIAASGAGDISGTLTNTTAAPVTVTFTITPANSCPGSPVTATVLVNPTPNVMAAPASQTKCSGVALTTIVLTGNVAGTIFNWTRDNNVAVTGIAAGGAGDISGTLTNTTTAPVTVTFTITPTANGCPGTPITATVLVNPTPTAIAAPASQTICSGGAITTIVLSGNVTGTIFNWTRDNTVAVTGIAANGVGNISGTLTNTTAAPVTVTFTITPTANGCPGTAITAIVIVSPPLVLGTAITPSCTGGATGIIDLTVSGGTTPYTYDWSNDGPDIPDNDTQDLTGLSGGTYTVTVTDVNGCSKTTSAVVAQSTAMTLTTTTMSTCVGGNIGSIDLTVSGGSPLYGYLWSNTRTTQDISGLGVGTYTVTVTDMNNCSGTTSAIITTLPLPCGWTAEANGVGCNNGNNVTYNFNTQIFTAASTNCFYPNPYTSDQHAFAQHDLCGNGSITAQVTSITGSLGWAGVIMRESNAPGAKKAQLMTNLSNFSRREFRISTNGQAYPQQFPSQNRYWLRITRTGDQFSMEVSPNGTAWYFAGAQNIVMGSCIEMGLVVTNYSSNSTVTATFANVSVTGGMTRPVINTPEDILAVADFTILPNPTNGLIEIDLSSYNHRKVQLEMYNLQGKLLRSMTLDVEKDKEEFDLTSFASGMYFIRVRAEGLADVTKRVVLNSNQ